MNGPMDGLPDPTDLSISVDAFTGTETASGPLADRFAGWALGTARVSERVNSAPRYTF